MYPKTTLHYTLGVPVCLPESNQHSQLLVRGYKTTAEATAAVGHTRAGVSVAVRSACAGLPLKPFCTRARCRCVFPGYSARNSAELEDEQSAPISHACVQQRELLVPGATTTATTTSTTTTPAVLVRYLQLRAYSSPHH